jgi:hypothetical protein
VAVVRLGVSASEFDQMSPFDLAWALWGERRRQHLQLRVVAWAVAHVMAPHVKQATSISPRKLFHAVTGGDLDEDEM